MPVLFSTVGTFGRVLAVLFFLCLSFAGITSLMSNFELMTHTFQDFGCKLTANINCVKRPVRGRGWVELAYFNAQLKIAENCRSKEHFTKWMVVILHFP